MSSKKLVLVTGASGFLGAQIVEHLIQAGYAVRGTSRSAKADQLRANYTHPDFEVTIIDDLVMGDFSLALTGVNSVIHVASPLSTVTNNLEVAVGGTLNLLRQAYATRVYKVTIIGSLASAFNTSEELLDPSLVVTDKHWRTITEAALKPGADGFASYAASKTLAERATWEFVGSHPEMDVITLLPPYVYGPIAHAQVLRRVATNPLATLSTNRNIYSLFSLPTPAYPPKTIPRQTVDVRDVAKAAVLSLQTKPSQVGEQRRILLCSGSFTWKQAVKYLASERPEIKGRLVDGGEPDPEEVTQSARLDTSKARDLLGLNDYIGWKKSIEDAADSLLKIEHLFIE